MGTYLSIPFTSRKVLQVEPSPKTAVKRDDLEVKDGEWVAGGKDPADIKPLTEEVIADLSRPLTPYEINEQSENVNVPMSPIHEEEEKKEEVKPTSWVEETPREKEITATMELIRNAMKNVFLEIDQRECKEEIVEPKAPYVSCSERIEAPRIPEFQPNANSASHAIKKYNRRHRKH